MPLAKSMAALACASAVLGAAPALAHPHVLVDAKEQLVFDQGKLTAIQHTWQFDEAFSAFATQGLDANNDGKLSAAELAPLAKVNVDSLAEFAFFTYFDIDGKDISFAAPTDYHLEFNANKLTLFFTLPLQKPVAIAGSATLEVFDPEYFVAFNFPGKSPVTLDHPPSGCGSTIEPPRALDAKTMAILSAIPPDQQILPPDLRQAASVLANVITVSCKGAPTASAAVGAAQAAAGESGATTVTPSGAVSVR
jgi:ABC-type uncharacterized transport system substrate-binding protein